MPRVSQQVLDGVDALQVATPVEMGEALMPERKVINASADAWVG